VHYQKPEAQAILAELVTVGFQEKGDTELRYIEEYTFREFVNR